MIVNYTGISENRIAPIAAKLWDKKPGQGLIICASASRAKRIAGDLSFFSSCPVLLLPDLETASLRYDAKSKAELSERLAVLAKLIAGEDVIVVAPIIGALKKLPPVQSFSKHCKKISCQEKVDRDDVISSLSLMGYERSNLAEAAGQFSVRGDIVDVFITGALHPVRIEFFDDEIDSIRSFDAFSQRSIESLDEILLTPAKLLVKDDEAFSRGLKGITAAYQNSLKDNLDQEAVDKLKEQRDYLISCIEDGINDQYLEAYISYFYESTKLIWDYLCNPSFVMVDDPSRISETLDFYSKEEAENRKIMIERFQAIGKDFDSYPHPEDIKKVNELSSDEINIYYTTPFTQQIKYVDKLDELESIEAVPAPVFAGHMDLLESELKRFVQNKYKVTIVCSDEDRISNLKDFLSRNNLDGKVELAFGSLSQGTDFSKFKEVYISENDIFAHTKQKRHSKKSKDREIKVFTDINIGDYVVHENHGVGKFTGVEKLEINGSTKDYLKIQYAGADVLYIPVDQLESLQKYVGSESIAPRINRLSGTDWQVTKEKAKAAIKEMAEDLIKLAAERSINPGYEFGPDSTWQKEFEDAFPYEETEDQIRSAEEIKQDMESPKAMDRLLCGDVGYGKTEVAARAIFKCLEAGKQAAVLVPTTILASQHFNTFINRFKDYPFAIDLLCRFRTDGQQNETIKKLQTGEVDLVVGTHRLLSSDVKFKDLGLLVIDEEQRFGVEHKEKIKQLKTNLDVLTLSATPIPRTLHMSMLGLRDLSVLEEPPEDRYPVQTYVMEQDDNMIADAIRRELGRDGQVYVVYNRVRGIQTMARHIKTLVPEAKVVVGHGQMSERELEDVMADFTAGETNVLLATTIIESGLDIPNVNTMIVLDADKFGLSQLYQLRGRVGRTNRMAYAYLVYKKDKVLSEVAEKRLRAIREFTEFGSGFKIAMRDMEIRGAGNILGVEQSGHMVAVGYELYCKMVEEAVKELKGEACPEDLINADSAIELALAAFIPENYIPDEFTRLSMYKRIASTFTDEDRLEVTDELIDRFGDLPKETETLLDVAMLRNKASKCGISKIIQQKGNVVFLFEKQNILKPEVFARLMDTFDMKLTIYAGVEPRLSLVLIDETAVNGAMEVLNCILEM